MAAPRLHQTGLRARAGSAQRQTLQAGVLLREPFFGEYNAANAEVLLAGASGSMVGAVTGEGVGHYVPPPGDAVNFSWVGSSAYTPPAGTAVNFTWANWATGIAYLSSARTLAGVTQSSTLTVAGDAGAAFSSTVTLGGVSGAAAGTVLTHAASSVTLGGVAGAATLTVEAAPPAELENP